MTMTENGRKPRRKATAPEEITHKDCGDDRHEGPNPLPLDAFHRKSDGVGGRAWRCKECANRAARESEKRKAERMGPKGYREHNKAKRRVNRERQAAGLAPDYDRRQQAARREALAALVDAHEDDFARFYIEAKRKHGLPPSYRHRGRG